MTVTDRIRRRTSFVGTRTETAAPGTELPTLTVVVCAYTMLRWTRLCAAIHSLEVQRPLPDEVILVIDHCPELAERAAVELPSARVVANRGPQGLSGARNTGIEEAHCAVVAFLDDDAVADPDWSARLLAAHADPDVLGVGGLVRPLWETHRPAWFPAEFDWVVGCTHRGMPAERSTVRNFIGANMAFRRDVLEAAGGFRTDLGRVGSRPLGCEETELCIRAAQREPEGRLVYEPAAGVRHHVPARRATWGYFRARCYAEGLSKARMTRQTGTQEGLSSERAYLRSVIPAAVLRAVRARGQSRTTPTAVLALVAGVGATGFGYLVGRARNRATPPSTDEPICESTPGPASEPMSVPTDEPTGSTAKPVLEPRAAGKPESAATTWLSRLALPLAVLLWVVSLRAVDLRAMNDLGLLSVLPMTFWAALALVTAGFAGSLTRRRVCPAWLAGHVLALIAFVHATPSILYPTLRYAWAWKHVGITQYLVTHGSVAPDTGSLQDVYNRWPGFFSLNALITRSTGAHSPLAYAAWAPPLVNLLILAPLVLLLRTATRDRRLIWGAAFVFYACSWVGQDYYAPQAFAFVLYLAVLAMVVRRLSGRPPGWRVYAVWGALLVLPVTAIASSHQLTPLALVTALAALAVPRKSRRTALLALGGATGAMVLWDVVVARGVLASNFSRIIDTFGSLGSNATSTPSGTGQLSGQQVVVDYTDRALTVAVCLLAVLGLLMRRDLRRSRLLLLALSPVPLVAANAYGGEIVLRVYMFALPALAFFAAAGIQAVVTGSRLARSRFFDPRVALSAVLAVVLAGGLVGYYGKERMNYFASGEVAAANYLSANAAPNSLIAGLTGDVPGGASAQPLGVLDLNSSMTAQERRALLADPSAELARLLAVPQGEDSYLILTRAQGAQSDMYGLYPRGEAAHLEHVLDQAPQFTLVYRNADASVYRLIPTSPQFLQEP